jgi:hypothetical protein
VFSGYRGIRQAREVMRDDGADDRLHPGPGRRGRCRARCQCAGEKLRRFSGGAVSARRGWTGRMRVIWPILVEGQKYGEEPLVVPLASG